MMNQDREWKTLMEEYKNVPIPENGLDGMKESIERAKQEKARAVKIKRIKTIGGWAAAVLLIAVILPNMNVNVAMAMEKIPLIGPLIRVVTFGRYDFQDENHEAKVEIPRVEVEDSGTGNTNTPNAADAEMEQSETTDNGEANLDASVQQSAESLNQDIQNYINPIVEEFEAGLTEEMKQALDISYDVITNNDDWFTLRINVLEIQASGYQYYKYYHINKKTGELAVLSDLFKPGIDYITPISEEIKRQMRERMASGSGEIFFLDDEEMPEFNFDKIKPDQNFYFNNNGEIVIAFDEYEVAPGFIGTPEFAIPKDITDSLRKE